MMVSVWFLVVAVIVTAIVAGLIVWLWLDKKSAALATDNARLASDLAAVRNRLTEIETLKSKAEIELAAVKADAAARLAALTEARDRLAAEFKALAADALSRNSDEFLKRANSELMKPVSESLKDVREKISEIEKTRATAYGSLSEQLKSLAGAQSALQTETTKLSRSLRSTATTGRWGEIQLQRVVELSGMVENVDFVQQTSGEEGRPDLIVRLPGGKQIAVDAKAPMQAYLEALEATDDNVRKAKFVEHARAVRAQIDALGKKPYWKDLVPAPEFVVLFIPGEAFYAAALRYEPDLFERGINVGVILASPATLIALLKAAAYGWKQEALSKNAEQIRDLGLELHERVSAIAKNLDELGQRLQQAVAAYNSTVYQTESQVLVTGRKFEKLGASSEKKIAEPRLVDETPKALSAPELKR